MPLPSGGGAQQQSLPEWTTIGTAPLRHAGSLIMSLEPRLLLDAAFTDTVAMADDAANSTSESTLADASSVDTPHAAAVEDRDQAGDQPDSPPAERIVIIDPSVPDIETILGGIDGDASVFVLDPDRSGLAQIAEILSGRTNVGELHIVSEGSDGGILLTGHFIHAGNVDQHATSLAQWHTALAPGADILLWGCDVVSDDGASDGVADNGQRLIEAIAAWTGADVAASNDLTGAASLGGDWDLEVATGTIEAGALLTDAARDAFAGRLATIVVNSTGDTDDGTPGNGITTLREAINRANGQAGADTITFDNSVFTDESAVIRVGSEMVITEDLTIQGRTFDANDATGLSRITISGDTVADGGLIDDGDTDGFGETRIFRVIDGVDSNFRDLVIRDGQAPDVPGFGNRSGGGLFGGKTSTFAPDSQMTLERVTLFNNRATSGGAGVEASEVTIRDSLIYGNTGAYAAAASKLIVDGSRIFENTISATALWQASDDRGSPHFMWLSNSSVTDNHGSGVGSGDGLIYNSTISGNESDNSVGGVRLLGGLIANSTITGNIGRNIGGVGKFFGDPSTFSESGRFLTIVNTVVAGNTSTTNAARADTGGIGFGGETVRSLGGNFVGTKGIFAGTDGVNGDQVGTVAAPLDPVLGPLTDNGGLTPTHTPLPGSPLLNQGVNSGTTGIDVKYFQDGRGGESSFTLPALTTDQRGEARIRGGTVDVGAVEAGDPTGADGLIVSTVEDVVADDGNISLREAIANANAASGQDTITFVPGVFDDAGGIIRLTSRLTISDDTIIQGTTFDATDATGLSRITISGDSDGNGDGDTGVFIVSGQHTVIFRDLVIRDGLDGAGNGAGIQATDSDIVLERITLENNEATSGSGGGIWSLGPSASLIVRDSTISNNRAGIAGGINATELQLIGTTVSGNSATSDAGGIRITNGAAATDGIIVNSTVSGNSAAVAGGVQAFGAVTIANSTITGNNATNEAGGLQARGTVTLASTVIAQNTVGGLADQADSDLVNATGPANTVSQGNNFIGVQTDFAAHANGSDQAGTVAAPLDARLGALADNGNGVQTHLPQAGSPLINRGDTAHIAGDRHGADVNGDGTSGQAGVDDLTTDQRGAARVQAGIVDIGAVEAPNADPVIALDAAVLAIAEDGAAAPLDPAATLTDDEGNWNTGTLVVQITGNPQAGDVLSLPDNVVGTINTDGTNLRDGATVIGTLSAAEGTVSGATALTITFNANATNDPVQQVLRAIHINTTADDPSATKTVTVTVSDSGTGTVAATRQLSVSGVNDNPSIASLPAGVTVLEDVAGEVDLSAATFSDPDSGARDITLTIAAGAGVLTAGNAGGVTVGGSGGNTITLTGTQAEIDAYLNTLAAITYLAPANANGANFDTLTLTANDGGPDVAVGTVSVTVTPVNDAPAVTNLDGDTVLFTEDGSAVVLDEAVAATLSDIDSSDFNGGTVTARVSAGGDATEDALLVGAVGPISTVGAAVFHGVTQIGTVTGDGVGANALVVSLNAAATPERVQDLLRAIQYDNTDTIDPDVTPRTVQVTVTDGDGTADGGADTSPTARVTVDIAVINDPPTLDNLDGDTVTFVEDGPAINLDQFGDASVPAGDSPDFDGGNVTVSFSANNEPAEDVLLIDGTGPVTLSAGVTVGSDVSVGGVVIGTINTDGTNGADLVVSLNAASTGPLVQTLVRALQYANTDMFNPDVTARTVTVTIDDGDGGVTSAADVTVNVQAVNDLPDTTGPSELDVTEATAAIVTADQFNFTDVDPGDALGAVRFDSVPDAATEGVFFVDANDDGLVDAGEAIAAGEVVDIADIDAGQFKFLSVAGGATGTAAAAFTYTVQDSGGPAFAAAPQTGEINITPLPDPDPLVTDDIGSGGTGDAGGGPNGGGVGPGQSGLTILGDVIGFGNGLTVDPNQGVVNGGSGDSGSGLGTIADLNPAGGEDRGALLGEINTLAEAGSSRTAVAAALEKVDSLFDRFVRDRITDKIGTETLRLLRDAMKAGTDPATIRQLLGRAIDEACAGNSSACQALKSLAQSAGLETAFPIPAFAETDADPIITSFLLQVRAAHHELTPSLSTEALSAL